MRVQVYYSITYSQLKLHYEPALFIQNNYFIFLNKNENILFMSNRVTMPKLQVL